MSHGLSASKERVVTRLRRFAAALFALCVLAGAGTAQGDSAPARIDPAQSGLTEIGRGALAVDLGLSRGVPYRVYTLDAPPRLVVDFQRLDWGGMTAEALGQSRHVAALRFGPVRDGWSRLVAELTGPMKVDTAELLLGTSETSAQLRLRLSQVDAAHFAAGAGTPPDLAWDLPVPTIRRTAPRSGEDTALVVVLDPGHGGLDPGAETDIVDEKTLMLSFARELQAVLVDSGFEVVLTREADRFVSLDQRIAIAHRAGADVFLSLHADSLAEGQAHGATVHVLSDAASDAASARLAERHDRADVLAGVDLSTADDEVTNLLLDLARQETRPRTEALARALVRGMDRAGGPMNTRPLRRAAFTVLKAADVPSVLVEIGFLSSARDLRNLTNPVWRAKMARGIRDGLLDWRAADAALRPRVRQ